jgi:hypothetical protein
VLHGKNGTENLVRCTLNQENLLKSRIRCGLTLPWTSEATYVSQHEFFVIFVLIFQCLDGCFHVCLRNFIQFQVPLISMSLCAEKLRLNYFQCLGNTPLSQWCELRHEAAFNNRQLFRLSTISLAQSFVLSRYYNPFLCIMCHMLWCNMSETAPLLTHNCWWNTFYVWRAAWNSAIQQQWRVYRK